MKAAFANWARRDRRAMFGWSVGVVAFIVLNLAFWPAFKDNAALTEITDNLGAAGELFGGAFGTAAGYLDAQVFSLMLPLMLVIFGISRGAAAIAGPEDSRALELLASQPLPRSRWASGRLAYAWAALIGLWTVSTASILVSMQLFGMDVSTVSVMRAALLSLALASVHFAFAFVVGALGFRRRQAIALTAVLAFVGYLMLGLGTTIESASFLRLASPWYWLGGTAPVQNPTGLAPVLGFGFGTASAVYTAVRMFERRDLR